jgi:dynein heavy chain
MQAELSALQPVLVEENAKASEQLIVVAREAEAANKIADAIAIEEAAARKIADNCEAIKKDCEEQLAEAMPALKAA